MTTRRIVGAVAVAVALGLAWWLRPESSNEPSSPTGSAESGGPRAEVVNALLTRPVAAPQGTLHLRGQVTEDGAGVEGATVTVTRLEVGERLVDRICSCANHCGLHLIDCGCGGSTEQLLALINQRALEMEPLARTRSMADGGFDLEGLAPGSYTVWADAQSGSAVLSEVTAGAEDARLELTPPIALSGQVVDEAHQGIEGARVVAVLGDHARELETMSGADGRFALSGVPHGDYAVLAMAEGWVPAHLHATPEASTDLTLKLLKPRQISGRVTFQGKPVAQAAVEVRGDERVLTATSGPDGQFAVGGLRPGEYQAVAQAAQGIGQRSATVAKGDVTDVVLELGPAGSIDGVVRDEEGPVAGAKLWVQLSTRPVGSSQQTKSDAQGRFHFGPLPLGSYSVSVAEAAHHQVGKEVAVQVADTTPTPVEVVLKKAAPLTGIVVDEAGQPVAKVSIEALQERTPAANEGDADFSGSRYGSATSTDAGTFAVEGLSAGTFALTLTQPEFVELTQKVVVPHEGLTLTMSHGSSVSGTVFDEVGKPLGGAQLSVYRESTDEERAEPKSAVSQSDGTFRVQGLRPGSYVLLAWELTGRVGTGHARDLTGGGGRRTTQTVKVGSGATTGIELRMSGTKTLSGVAQDASGAALAGVRIQASVRSPDERATDRSVSEALSGVPQTAVSDSDGGFLVRHLDDGSYYVWGELDGYHRSAALLHVAAGTDDLVVMLATLPKVRGHVVDDSGAPVAAFRVNRRSFTDPDAGFFEVPVDQPGAYQLWIQAQDSTSKVLTGTVAEGEVHDVGEVVLSAGRTVHGIVVDETGAPVAAARVFTSEGAGSAPFAASSWQARMTSRISQSTGVDGTFTLQHVPPEAAQITADDSKHQPATRPLGPTDDNLTLTLTHGASVHGVVLDASQAPISTGIEVSTTDGSTQRWGASDATGHYAISGLPGGRATLNLEVPNGVSWAGNAGLAPRTVTLPEGGDVTVDLVATSGGATLQVTLGADLGPRALPGLVSGDVAAPTQAADIGPLQLAMAGGGGVGRSTYQGLADGTYTVFGLGHNESGLLVARQVVTVSGGAPLTVSLSSANATVIAMPDQVHW